MANAQGKLLDVCPLFRTPGDRGVKVPATLPAPRGRRKLDSAVPEMSLTSGHAWLTRAAAAPLD
jgi:hypothetical protein